MSVPKANRRSHSLRTLTCRHCSKQFQATHRLDFCSSICRYADATTKTQNTQNIPTPAQEGATTHDHSIQNNR